MQDDNTERPQINPLIVDIRDDLSGMRMVVNGLTFTATTSRGGGGGGLVRRTCPVP